MRAIIIFFSVEAAAKGLPRAASIKNRDNVTGFIPVLQNG